MSGSSYLLRRRVPALGGSLMSQFCKRVSHDVVEIGLGPRDTASPDRDPHRYIIARLNKTDVRHCDLGHGATPMATGCCLKQSRIASCRTPRTRGADLSACAALSGTMEMIHTVRGTKYSTYGTVCTRSDIQYGPSNPLLRDPRGPYGRRLRARTRQSS